MASAPVMEFEKPIADLEKQIDELKRLAGGQKLNVTDEIAPLERKLSELREEIYRNLSPIQRVQVARNNRRPFTLDYIKLVFTDWIELHGDRAFRDDAAIVGGWARLDGETVTPLAAVQHSGQVAIAIQLVLGAIITPEVMHDVRSVVEAHPGPSALELHWSDGNGSRARLRSRSLKLSATNAALAELRAVLGLERVKLVRGS